MKIQLLIIGLTLFLAYDTYHEGRYSSMLFSYKKYYRVGVICFLGLSLLIFMKKHPVSSRGLLTHANDFIKYMPIDSNARDMITPFFDFTSMGEGMSNYNDTPQMKRMMNSGRRGTSRSVSETKKKYVASEQGWKCNHCGEQLDATFEVDHKIDLQYGGSNHVSNLAALCRGCHAKKGMMNKL
tara:strand:+ start:1694 stop:2242 length:549 start_codon:yes stop_codon:yes gene_type:complete